jgi:Glyoxalase/Bleomycin resistance protein/Dioxygenase superfamily
MALGNLDVHHVGVVVDDLDVAMDQISRDTGVTWAPVMERAQRLRTGDGEVAAEHLRFTYSREGTPHIELLESREKRFWQPGPAGTLHHLGSFVSDLIGESARLAAGGLPVEFGGGERERPLGFVYHVAAAGVRIELIDGARKPDFERWLAGGRLAEARG